MCEVVGRPPGQLAASLPAEEFYLLQQMVAERNRREQREVDKAKRKGS